MKNYIFNTIWGEKSESENQTLTVHIKMLRDKIKHYSLRGLIIEKCIIIKNFLLKLNICIY